MAIKCGNCRESHETVAEVRGCHGEQAAENAAAAAEARPSRGPADITEPQARFILDLLRERNLDEEWVAEQFGGVVEGLTKSEASEVISTLKEMPRESGVEREVPNGTYTVILDEAAGSYRTLRLRDDFRDDQENGQMAEFLSGPENTRDFTGFAFVEGRTFRTWKRFRDAHELREALEVLLEDTDPQAAMERYAMNSGNCARCGRTLTVPASLHRGVGPVCAGKLGW